MSLDDTTISATRTTATATANASASIGQPRSGGAAQLPPTAGSLPHLTAHGQTLRVEGTNVVRVPFGVRRPRRSRPERPERWATVVLPFQSGGSTPTPPQAA